jgi:hypothetical protein
MPELAPQRKASARRIVRELKELAADGDPRSISRRLQNCPCRQNRPTKTSAAAERGGRISIAMFAITGVAS